MQLEIVKNAKRNMLFGIINKIVIMLLPFLVRTIIIKELGADYLGLDSLFTSILQVLNLSELGFGTAIVYSMYKPITENDEDTICALLSLYRKIYKVVGVVILCIGILLLPFLPRLIKGGYPSELNIYILYLVYLSNTVISYLLFAYKTSLLNAFQREDVISNISTITKTFLYIVQMIVVVLFDNYYIYILVLPISTILNNLIVTYDVKKRYPQYVCKGKVSDKVKKDIKTKVAGLMVSKVCQVSRNAFDSIFISAFLGLTVTAMYNNYYYVITAVTVFMGIISTSLMAGIGNNVASFSADKNYEDMRKLDYVYMLIGGWSSIFLLCLYQPFMLIWIGEEYQFSFDVVVLFVVYFYALKIGDIRSTYVNATGLWWENRFRSILEATSNIVLNYILGRYFGIHGIIGATLFSIIVVNFLYGSRIIFEQYFRNGKFHEYVKNHFKYAIVTVVVAGITYNLCAIAQFDVWILIVYRMVVCVIVPFGLYYFIYRTTEIYKCAMPWLLEKFHLEKKLKFLITSK